MYPDPRTLIDPAPRAERDEAAPSEQAVHAPRRVDVREVQRSLRVAPFQRPATSQFERETGEGGYWKSYGTLLQKRRRA